MNIQIVKGQTVRKHLQLVNDADGSVIPCTFNAEGGTSSDSNVCSVSSPADATIDFVGVNIGNCNVTVTSSCAYTDPLSGQAQTQNKSIVIAINVVPVTANTSMTLV